MPWPQAALPWPWMYRYKSDTEESQDLGCPRSVHAGVAASPKEPPIPVRETGATARVNQGPRLLSARGTVTAWLL